MAALGLVVVVAACADGGAGVDGGIDAGVEDPSAFIALPRDFQGFQEWERVFAGLGGLSGTSPHGDLERWVHVNRRPADDDGAFPVGTILVKTHEDAAVDPTEWNIFAMVKRSPRFNVDGARGWEWFELKLDAEGQSIIVWRGVTPPTGESYGCLTTECAERGSCNVCHAHPETDSVLSPELDYSAQFTAHLVDGGAL